jgi:hypothetical protein
MTAHNPYAPPSVTVADREDENYGGEETLIPGGRTCPAGSGWSWMVQGWQMFKTAPLMFWVVLLISMMIYIVMAIIPVVNFLASIAMPLFVAGFGSCAYSTLREGRFEVGQIFDGCRKRPGTQLLCGLIYFGLIFGSVFAIAMAFGATGLLKGMMGGHMNAASAGSFMLVMALIGLVVALIVPTVIYAPYLIQEHEELSATEAMQMSFKGCFRNIASGLVFMVVMVVLAIVASIPFGLGWLVLFPVSYLALYASYRDIFIAQSAED